MTEPRARLFVDVDGTLNRWLPPRAGVVVTEFEPNEDVIAFVRDWHARHPGGDVVVWSNSGTAWAREHAARCLPDVPYRVVPKEPVRPGPGDLFLDDAPYPSFAAKTIDPGDIRA